jgi:hypothetical protein
LERLEQAVSRSDMAMVAQVISEIGGQEPAVGEMLAALAADFKYRHILALIQASKVPQNGQ